MLSIDHKPQTTSRKGKHCAQDESNNRCGGVRVWDLEIFGGKGTSDARHPKLSEGGEAQFLVFIQGQEFLIYISLLYIWIGWHSTTHVAPGGSSSHVTPSLKISLICASVTRYIQLPFPDLQDPSEIVKFSLISAGVTRYIQLHVPDL